MSQEEEAPIEIKKSSEGVKKHLKRVKKRLRAEKSEPR